jgi:hypothetical protein
MGVRNRRCNRTEEVEEEEGEEEKKKKKITLNDTLSLQGRELFASLLNRHQHKAEHKEKDQLPSVTSTWHCGRVLSALRNRLEN